MSLCGECIFNVLMAAALLWILTRNLENDSEGESGHDRNSCE